MGYGPLIGVSILVLQLWGSKLTIERSSPSGTRSEGSEKKTHRTTERDPRRVVRRDNIPKMIRKMTKNVHQADECVKKQARGPRRRGLGRGSYRSWRVTARRKPKRNGVDGETKRSIYQKKR